MKKGFTLVELAIILVIVGLLIGGIVAARSMVSTAESLSIVRDIEKYDIAISNFIRAYKQFPGDSSYFTPPGNASNAFDFNSACLTGSNNRYVRIESYYVWAHVSQAKMFDKTFATYSPTTCTGGIHNAYEPPLVPTIPVTPWPRGNFANTNKTVISTGKSSSNQFMHLSFTVDARTAIYLSRKLLVTDTNTKSGLYITNPPTCFDDVWPYNSYTTSCFSPTALYTTMTYFINASVW